MKLFKKIGAEIILTVIVAPFIVWIITSINELEASQKVNDEKIFMIKTMLEKQDVKLDRIYDVLIGRK